MRKKKTMNGYPGQLARSWPVVEGTVYLWYPSLILGLVILLFCTDREDLKNDTRKFGGGVRGV